MAYDPTLDDWIPVTDTVGAYLCHLRLPVKERDASNSLTAEAPRWAEALSRAMFQALYWLEPDQVDVLVGKVRDDLELRQAVYTAEQMGAKGFEVVDMIENWGRDGQT